MQSRMLLADVAVLLAVLVILSVPLFIWVKQRRDKKRRRLKRRSSVDRPYFFEGASRERIARARTVMHDGEAASLSTGDDQPRT